MATSVDHDVRAQQQPRTKHCTNSVSNVSSGNSTAKNAHARVKKIAEEKKAAGAEIACFGVID